MFKATIAKISLPYGIFLTKVFKFFKIDLNNKKKKTPKSIRDEYNEKTLKRMGYILKNNKWTPKPTKKNGGVSASKKKTLFRNSSRQRSVKKNLIHDFESSEGEMGVFMAQVMELLEKLNKKIDIASTRLLFLK